MIRESEANVGEGIGPPTTTTMKLSTGAPTPTTPPLTTTMTTYNNDNRVSRNLRCHHVNDDDNRNQGRDNGAYDRAAGVKGCKHGEASQQRRCHRDNGSEGSTDMGFEFVGLVNSREIFCTVIMPKASLDSC
jgi:hypothetical protein